MNSRKTHRVRYVTFFYAPKETVMRGFPGFVPFVTIFRFSARSSLGEVVSRPRTSRWAPGPPRPVTYWRPGGHPLGSENSASEGTPVRQFEEFREVSARESGSRAGRDPVCGWCRCCPKSQRPQSVGGRRAPRQDITRSTVRGEVPSCQ